MSSEKNYHALIPDEIFMGTAADVEWMVKNEGISTIEWDQQLPALLYFLLTQVRLCQIIE